MRKIKSVILCIVCLFALLLVAVGCSAEQENAGEYKVTVEGMDNVKCSETYADEGDTVRLDLPRIGGYRTYAVYVDGVMIDGYEFTMPSNDVHVKIAYASESQAAHAITASSDSEGCVVPDKSYAEAGESVTLTCYSGYNRRLVAYTVNGKNIDGNSFTMPDCAVTVSAEFETVVADTPVSFSVSAGRYSATSHWYAQYKEDGLAVRAVVEDTVVYTSSKLVKDIGYHDNIEFIVAKQSDRTFGVDTVKVLVTANGDRSYSAYRDGWVAADSGGVTMNARKLSIAGEGFSGYEVEVIIPYAKLGTTYSAARGNLAICPAMRNTLSYFHTNWKAYSGMGCDWNKPATYLALTENNEFAERTVTARVLVAGDGFISAFESVSLADTDDTFSYIVPHSTTAWWKNNVSEIAKFKPETVYFSCSGDFTGGNYLDAFGNTREFLTALKRVVSGKIVVVSSVPTISSDCDCGEVAAYNAMVEDYAEATGYADYIDLTSHIYDGKVLDTSLYGSATTLSDTGNMLLDKLYTEKYGAYVEPEGVWGDVGNYISCGDWTDHGYYLTLESSGTSFTYLKEKITGDFVFEAQITVNARYNNDSYPKFGLTLTGAKGAESYFIYADGLTKQSAGTVKRFYSGYDWNNATEVAVSDLAYTSGRSATLRLERSGDVIRFGVNGTLVHSGQNDMFDGTEVTLGLFSFNLGLGVEYGDLSTTEDARL